MFQISMRFQQSGASRRHVVRPHGLKRLARAGRIGVGRFERAAQLGDALRRRLAYGGDLAVDRAMAEIGRPGDAAWRHRRVDGALERHGRLLHRQRIAALHAGIGVEHQRHVADIARHRPVDGKRLERNGAWAGRHAAGAGTEADHRAERGGIAQATAEIGAGRQPYLAGGQGDGGAAGGAGAGHARVPRIAGNAEHLVEGLGAGAEFGRVGLADHQRAARLEIAHPEIGFGRDVVLVDRRAEGGAHAFDVVEILDADRQAAEPARMRLVERLEAGDAGAGALEAQGRHRVEAGIGRRHPLLGSVDQFGRRHLALAQQVDRLPRRQPPQLRRHARHLFPPRSLAEA